MRGAAAATVATVVFGCGLSGCQEEVTAIRLIVSPDDAVRVRQADHLEVFVGYGMEVVPRDLRVHADDGRTTTYDVGAFLEPIDIYLTDDGANRPFWVGVRAVHKATGLDEIVGEGGHATPLAFAPGVVLEARVGVKPTRDLANDTRLPEVWAGCPGWTDEDGTRHHIVGEMNTADCDEDGHPYTQGADDCDDFDPAFNPMAQDMVCDHIDHTCGRNPFVGTDDRCVGIIDPGSCVLGTTTCVDTTAPPANCEGPGTPMPPEICQNCSATVGYELFNCIKDTAPVRATCLLFHDGANFCQTELIPLPIQPSWWLHAGGTATGGLARWLRLTPPSALSYGWVTGDVTMPSLVVGTQTVMTPPSPAFYIENGDVNTTLGDSFQDTNLAVITGPPTGPELIVVDVDVQAAADCTSVPLPECQQWPINMGAN